MLARAESQSVYGDRHRPLEGDAPSSPFQRGRRRALQKNLRGSPVSSFGTFWTGSGSRTVAVVAAFNPSDRMASNGKLPDKRTVDMRVIGDWVEPGSRVLDLGCGRGVLLEYLVHTKGVQGVGVDFDFEKVAACVKRGLTAYQGDLEEFLRAFPNGHFDRVICSRTLEELARPASVINEALRVGRCLVAGFVNYGYWKNRLSTLRFGRKPLNEVFRTKWSESRPSNPVSVADFETFCADERLVVLRKELLRGDWVTPCQRWPNWFAGYAVYEIGR